MPVVFLRNPHCLFAAKTSKSVSGKRRYVNGKKTHPYKLIILLILFYYVILFYDSKASGSHRLCQYLKKKHSGEQGKMLQKSFAP